MLKPNLQHFQHHEPNRYFDPNFGCDAVKILPGEYFVTHSNTMIVTVLGSCVSVCLYDPLLHIGGMNHFLLPCNNSNTPQVLHECGRYGVYAMELLINDLLKLGARRNALEAKIFGGGNMMQGFSVHNIGEQNAEFVVNYLNLERIPIIAADLLDIYPRKVYFFPQTGKVKVRKIKKLHNTTIIDREKEYRLRVREMHTKAGDIDLFGDKDAN